MNDLQIFKDSQFGEVRTIIKDGEPWFVAKDVADILGYSETSAMTRSHVDEDDLQKLQTVDAIGKSNTFIVINESGLFSSILGATIPQAKAFKKWVTSEILPSIRKNGMYATDKLLDNPDLLIAAVTKLKEERAARLLAESQIERDRPKVVFAEALEISESSILVGDLAKILRQNGIQIGQNRLFEELRREGYLISRKGESFNMPTQRSMDAGLFEIKVRTVNNPDGSLRQTKTPKVTGKGQIYFINKFKTSTYQTNKTSA